MKLGNIIKFLTLGLACSTMTACANMPGVTNYDKLKGSEVRSNAINDDEWLQDPAIKTIFSNVGKNITEPNSIPENIKKKDIDIKLMPNATMQDLLTALSEGMNIPTLSDSKELSDTPIYLPSFKGKVGDLLGSISKSKNLSFVWDNNVLTLKKSASYMITVPQDDTLMEKVANELAAIGAEDISKSVSAGALFYSSTPRNQEKIEKYFTRLVKNSSLITLQIMVINVNLDRERKQGFDWSQLQAKIGDFDNSSNSNNSGGDFLGGDGGGSSNASASATSSQQYASATGSSFALNVSKSSFDLVGLFNLLSTYGNTKTTQDVSLKTISGKEVKVVSAQEVPYVSDVSLSTTDTGVSNSGLDTDVAKSGITMGFKPYYEDDSKLVSIDIDINLDTLLGFTELSAGNQFGTITQPRTQKQQFNNTVRIPVGETVILGGVTYESISDNRSSLSILDDADIANKNVKVTNNSLFVLIRPTVVIYEPKIKGI